ncbi:MAG: ThiF family adenylyltransferase [Chthoniobacteraceae bacterium]
MNVTLIGLGNIGSQLAPLLARMPGAAAFTLIDHDRYAPENLATQNIAPGDAGSAKAIAAGQRLREQHPHLRVTSIVQRVEDVPLGALRADAIVSCVDSLAARLTIAEAAWRLGVPCFDTGVLADGSLARVSIQVAGEDQPCLQCAWSDRDYARMEQRYVCQPAQSFSTNAPAWLGALAASLAAGEIARLLAGDRSAAGKILMLDAQHHTLTSTRVLRFEHCRFDHAVWPVALLGARAHEATLGALLSREDASLRVWNQPWVSQRACTGCGRAESAWHLRGRLAADCECGASLLPMGFHTIDAFTAAETPADLLPRTFSSLGVRDGDVAAVTNSGAVRYIEFGTP